MRMRTVFALVQSEFAFTLQQDPRYIVNETELNLGSLQARLKAAV